MKTKDTSAASGKSVKYTPLASPEAPPTKQEVTQDTMKKKGWEMLFCDNGRWVVKNLPLSGIVYVQTRNG